MFVMMMNREAIGVMVSMIDVEIVYTHESNGIHTHTHTHLTCMYVSSSSHSVPIFIGFPVVS